MSDKTINEHIVMLRSYKKLMWGTECDKRYGESFSVAIDIMQKYQKIEQIVMKSPNEFKQCGLKELKQILEVLAYE